MPRESAIQELIAELQTLDFRNKELLLSTLKLAEAANQWEEEGGTGSLAESLSPGAEKLRKRITAYRAQRQQYTGGR